MIKSLLAFAAGVLACFACAMPVTYKVKQGENDWTISHQLHLKVSQLRAMNPGVNWNRLRPGVVLRISPSNGSAPAVTAPIATATATAIPTSSRTAFAIVKARSDDNDWTLAKRFHTSAKSVRLLNPNVDWRRVRPGLAIRIPTQSSSLAISTPASAKVFPVAAKGAKTSVPGTYRATREDNDWTIAKRFGLTPHTLRAANPGVNWSKLRPGLAIRLPARESTVAKLAKPRAIPAAKRPSLAVRTAPPLAMPIESKLPSILVYSAGADDNDWIIAHKFGVTPPIVRAANPKVDWNRLRPGTKIRIPSMVNGHVIAKANGIHTHYAVLRGEHVNVRAGARTDAASILKVDGGTPAVVVDRVANWYKLEFPHGTKGWVRGDFLEASAIRPKQLSAYETEDRSVIIAREEREEAVASEEREARAERIFRREREAEQEVASRHRRHYGGSHHHSEDDADYPVARGGGSHSGILSAAEGMLGARYRYGAASRSATDCSGFTSQVFARNGFRLPRTAREQSQIGHRVSRDGLKPGDLVFFNTLGNGVSHVGIYEGNNSFIHASSAKGHVTISKLDGYYARRFVGARRVQ